MSEGKKGFIMTYQEQLKDPRWQMKRLEILKRDNCTCKLCLSNKKTLHIHHKTYKGFIWEVDNKQLITLCKDCHEIVHNIIKANVFKATIDKDKETDYILAIVRILLISDDSLTFRMLCETI